MPQTWNTIQKKGLVEMPLIDTIDRQEEGPGWDVIHTEKDPGGDTTDTEG